MSGIGVTQAELVRRTRAKLSEAGVKFFTPENVLDWLNEGQDVICADAPFTVVSMWQSRTTPNTSSYLLDPACVIPAGVLMRISTDRVIRLTYVEPDVDDDQRSLWIGAGSPTTVSSHVTNEGTALDFWVAPSEPMDFYVEGFKRPTPLTSTATDRSDIPPYLVSTVIKYAVAQAKYKDEEMQQYGAMMADFNADLERLAERRLATQADQYNLVRWRRAMRAASWPYREVW